MNKAVRIWLNEKLDKSWKKESLLPIINIIIDWLKIHRFLSQRERERERERERANVVDQLEQLWY